MKLDQLKYPIGKFERPKTVTKETLSVWISDISSFPDRLQDAVSHLSDEQLDTAYRPDGWTIRQVVHHCADSHMNALIRLKLALTEDQPTIKPYKEEKWAELGDSALPIATSLRMLEGIHEKWTVLLSTLREDQLSRTFVHPDHESVIRIDENTGMYAWHGNHHLTHITEAKRRYGWS